VSPKSDIEDSKSAWLVALERGWWAIAPALCFLVYRAVGGFDFVADARFLIPENLTLRDPRSFWDQLTHDYFWSTSGNIIPYWRPITKLAWFLEWRLFGTWAGGYLWMQVALHALMVLGVQVLARRVGCSRFASFLAGAYAAVHPVAFEPVSLVMAHSDVAAATAGVWSVVAWLAWRGETTRELGRARTRRREPVFLALHVIALALALGSKEVALAWPALLVVWSAVMGDLWPPRREKLVLLAPALGLSVMYLVARHAVLSGVASGLEAVRLSVDPVKLLTGLGLYLRNLLPILESTVRDTSFAEARSASALALGLVSMTTLALATAWFARRRDRVGIALTAGMVLTLAPVLLTRDISVPQVTEKFPLADRWLYQALPCAAVAGARLFDHLADVARTLWARRVAAVGMGSWVVLVLVRSASATSELGSELRMLDNEDRLFYANVPEAYRTHDDHCRYQERRLVRDLLLGKPTQVVANAPEALEVCSDRPEVAQHVLEAFVLLRRFKDAAPLAKSLAQNPPGDRRAIGRLSLNLGQTFFHTGTPVEAERWLTQAVNLGHGGCRTFILLGEAARTQGAIDRAADRLERAFSCGGERDPSLLIAAATWLAETGDHERARRLLGRSKTMKLSEDQAEQVTRVEAEMREPGSRSASPAP
jgi:hypothetical protein